MEGVAINGVLLYVHFLSVSRLLVDLGAVDPQDLKDRKPKIGEVLITPHRRFNIYSLIVKQNHFEKVNEEYVKVAIHNLRIALEKENISEFRISRHGDIIVTHYQKENYASY